MPRFVPLLSGLARFPFPSGAAARAVLSGAALASALVLLTAPLASAQETLSADEYIAYLDALAAGADPIIEGAAPVAVAAPAPRRITPASTVGIPSGFALPRGAGFLSVAGSDVRERVNDPELDGSLAVGLGFGDALRGVGFEAIVGISSVEGVDFGDSGSLNLKLSRQVASPFAGGVASLSLGVGRAAAWGDMEGEDPNIYVAGTSTFALGQSGLGGIVTAGYGTAVGTLEDEPGGFVGFGLGLNEYVSVGASWYGNEALVGTNIVAPLSDRVNVQLGVQFADVTQENSDGRWAVSLSIVALDLY